jgi:hypothetical protein
MSLPLTTEGWALTVPAQGVAAVRVQSASRILRTAIGPAGAVRLTVEAPMGSTQVLEASPDLTLWDALSTNPITTSTTTDLGAGAASLPRRFFRLGW